ncbi:hypothetical protein J6590_085512 [Homalodisca vitripennis]|nr:hypothetical protein J6590_085512 [Homalodisca vitripennis]
MTQEPEGRLYSVRYSRVSRREPMSYKLRWFIMPGLDNFKRITSFGDVPCYTLPVNIKTSMCRPSRLLPALGREKDCVFKHNFGVAPRYTLPINIKTSMCSAQEEEGLRLQAQFGCCFMLLYTLPVNIKSSMCRSSRILPALEMKINYVFKHNFGVSSCYTLPVNIKSSMFRSSGMLLALGREKDYIFKHNFGVSP